MNLVRKFTKDEAGSTAVEWVVLTAAIVGTGLAVSVAIFGGTNTATQALTDDVYSVASGSSAALVSGEAPQAKTLTVDAAFIDTRFPPTFPLIKVAAQAAPVQCENTSTTYDHASGLPRIVCQKTSDVLSAPRPELFFYETPEILISQTCENLSRMYHDLVVPPQILCEKDTVVLASVTPAAHPASLYVEKAGNFHAADPCLVTSDQGAASTQGCQLADGVIKPTVAETLPMFASLATTPEFTKPAECRRATCQFTRKSEAKAGHSYRSVTPAFTAPVRCGNPPCVFSRPADAPQAPSMPTFGAPSDHEAPTFQYYEETTPEDTDTLLLSDLLASSEQEIDVAYVVSIPADAVTPKF